MNEYNGIVWVEIFYLVLLHITYIMLTFRSTINILLKYVIDVVLRIVHVFCVVIIRICRATHRFHSSIQFDRDSIVREIKRMQNITILPLLSQIHVIFTQISRLRRNDLYLAIEKSEHFNT